MQHTSIEKARQYLVQGFKKQGRPLGRHILGTGRPIGQCLRPPLFPIGRFAKLYNQADCQSFAQMGQSGKRTKIEKNRKKSKKSRPFWGQIRTRLDVLINLHRFWWIFDGLKLCFERNYVQHKISKANIFWFWLFWGLGRLFWALLARKSCRACHKDTYVIDFDEGMID